MLEAQNYACSICARVMVNDTFKQAAAEPTGEIEWAPVQRKSILATPHVDYCPKTGVVRGLVCVACLKLLASATEPLELLQKCIVIIKQPKWVNPRPNRRRIRRKRKSHIARKEMLNTRLIPRERRVRLLDYFARELDESLVSECWRAGASGYPARATERSASGGSRCRTRRQRQVTRPRSTAPISRASR